MPDDIVERQLREEVTVVASTIRTDDSINHLLAKANFWEEAAVRDGTSWLQCALQSPRCDPRNHGPGRHAVRVEAKHDSIIFRKRG